ncbi:hypothetical protein [Kitasatospora sp. NPDC056181]|uniref:hypothetical protein n=1 Tax=Kitasatospora sp. NPDC056181 TaxID=3345737 RepID=UPI0035DFD252
MTDPLLPERTQRRPWPLVALAGVSWLPAAAGDLPKNWGSNGDSIIMWCLALIVTLLPLTMPSPKAFRRSSLIIGWLQFGTEIIYSLSFLLIPLPFFVAISPAGVLLLLASRKTGGRTRTTAGTLLAATPFILFFSSGGPAWLG